MIEDRNICKNNTKITNIEEDTTTVIVETEFDSRIEYTFISKEMENKVDIGQTEIMARKSVVQVYFPERHASYAYYNDRFDLKCGDIVFVEGKLEGIRGRVTEVNYNFKIKEKKT